MNRREEDYRAFFDLVSSEKKRLSDKRALLKALENELEKDEGALDPVLAASLVDGLYEAGGLTPPLATEREAEDFAARIKGRRESGRMPRLKRPRFAARRAAAAVCFVILFAFSANYVTALVSGACFAAKAGVRVCCGTKYCPCRIEAEENAAQKGNH